MACMSHSQTSTVWSPRRALTRVVNCWLESAPPNSGYALRNVAPSCWPEQPGFGLRAGDTAEEILVGKFVCSGSELSLDSFKWLLNYFSSSGIGLSQIWNVGEVLLDDRGVQFGKGHGDLAWFSERVPQC